MKTHRKIMIFLIVIPGFLLFQNSINAQENKWEWARPVYSSASNSGYSIISDKAGNSFVAGSFTDTLHIGGEKLVSRGHSDIFIAAFSVEGDIKWLKQAGGPDADEAYGITLDGEGDIVATGYISGLADFSEKIANSYGVRDFFVTKLDKEGNVLWVRSGKVSNGGFANFVCTDNKSNVFISGFFHGTMYVGTSEFKSTRHKDLFIMKYDSDGNLRWVKVGGGDEKDGISAMHADADGNLYVTGSFEKVLILDKMLIESSGRKDIFLAKYDNDGMLKWLRNGGSATGNDFSTAIELDTLGNIYVTGFFSGIAYFKNKKLVSTGADDIFLLKYDPKGDVLWAKQTGGKGNEHARAMIMDSSGNVYLAGDFDLSFTFAKKKINKSGDCDVFVLRFSEDGKMAGGNMISGQGYKKATNLAIDGKGNVYLLGYFVKEANFGDISLKSPGTPVCGFIAKMNPLPPHP